ncbi:MAG: Cof-type HAD-IIB family hydrolase [Clostridia bacterium]
MRYKLLAFDIDDTLLPRTRVIPERNIRAIERAKKIGYLVTLATGRGFLASKPIFEQLNLFLPIINYGGAIIMDPKTGECILATAVAPELVIEILDLANSLNLHAHLYQGDGVVCEKDSAYAPKYAKFLNIPYTIDPDIRKKVWENVPKMLIYAPEYTDYYMKLITKHFEGRLKVSGSVPGFIELNHIDANKGAALEYLANMYGLTMDGVAAMGDNTLDLEMLNMVGFSGAPADAKPEIIKTVDFVSLATCEEGAVAEFIERILGEA